MSRRATCSPTPRAARSTTPASRRATWTASAWRRSRLTPDHAVDLAWRLGLHTRWLMDDANGGASGINLLTHALRAVEAGDASVVLLPLRRPLGDRGLQVARRRLQHRHARPPGADPHRRPERAVRTAREAADGGARAAARGPRPGRDRAARLAARNPGAVYREPLTVEQYLAAPLVADPLTVLDCVPIVAGADALVVAGESRSGRPPVRVRAPRRGSTRTTRRARGSPRAWPKPRRASGPPRPPGPPTWTSSPSTTTTRRWCSSSSPTSASRRTARCAAWWPSASRRAPSR